MPKAAEFTTTFTALRAILEPYAAKMIVAIDKPGEYQLSSATLKDRIGRPLYVAAVQIKKSYVSFHLLPIYADPALLKEVSPSLRKRMQVKSCFNFTTVDPEHIKELSALTKKGIDRFKNIKLPWSG